MANMYQDEEIILKVKELTNKIKEDKLYQDYMKLRQELKKDENITQTIEEIKRLQRKYVKTNYQDKEVLEKINNLTNELEKIPLYAIYQQKEEELNNNLVFINEGLKDTFSSIVDYEQDWKKSCFLMFI